MAGEPEGLEREGSLNRFNRIIDDNNTFADVLLVGVLRFEHAQVHERTKVGRLKRERERGKKIRYFFFSIAFTNGIKGVESKLKANLVPTNEVAVDVNITKTTHHLDLVLCVFLIFSLIVTRAQKGEAVGDFQGGGIVQTQQLSCFVIGFGW